MFVDDVRDDPVVGQFVRDVRVGQGEYVAGPAVCRDEQCVVIVKEENGGDASFE